MIKARAAGLLSSLVARTQARLAEGLRWSDLGFAALAAFVGTRLPVGGRVLTLASAALVGVVYAVALVVTRELGGDDLALVRRVIGRKR